MTQPYCGAAVTMVTLIRDRSVACHLQAVPQDASPRRCSRALSPGLAFAFRLLLALPQSCPVRARTTPILTAPLLSAASFPLAVPVPDDPRRSSPRHLTLIFLSALTCALFRYSSFTFALPAPRPAVFCSAPAVLYVIFPVL
ncbi:hypothetical protein SKAU_G00267760 [Synaphobranchus kaupii]|uniref:Uncharacterized protein n=1 Tax=Synaphobranchus kaupii TaxID=118154 RepID=A0A9Q1EZN0_SYNKA|nr:hypothetical protein SKAU_G00267760 [Synaphobranchus kaupii]